MYHVIYDYLAITKSSSCQSIVQRALYPAATSLARTPHFSFYPHLLILRDLSPLNLQRKVASQESL